MTSLSSSSSCRNHDDDSNNNNNNDNKKKEFHVAPMMQITYREFRYFIRLLTKHAILWTEMIVDDTILHTQDLAYHLGIFDATVPVICQFGGNQASQAAAVTRRIRAQGYTEINLNAGCPSRRVAGQRAFGAALLQNVPNAIDMLRAMREAIQDEEEDKDDDDDDDAAKISIKLRIGVNSDDDWTWTHQLIAQLSTVCQRFYVHARKVHTAGLDPAQNRRIPPLDYPRVYALCRAFPDCEFWINGGISTLAQAKDICFGVEQDAEQHATTLQANQHSEAHQQEHYAGLIPPGHGRLPCPTCQQPNGSCVTPPIALPPDNLRGCMVGRAMVDDPMQFATLDTDFFGDTSNPGRNRRHVLQQYAAYLHRLYPRRCGDEWEDETQRKRVTVRPPGIIPLQDYYCPHCQNGSQERPVEKQELGNKHGPTLSPPHLIHQFAIGRALKPVQGIFCGIPGMSKSWRRLLQKAMNREKQLFNCGPGFVLERAVQRMEEEGDERVTALLDCPFGQGDENRSGNAP